VAERGFGFKQGADCVAETAGEAVVLSTASDLRQNHWLKENTAEALYLDCIDC